MQIDFTSTAQNENNLIEFYNTRGQIVKTYPLSQLELWVIEQDLLNTGEVEEIAECESPFSKHFKLVDSPIYEDLTDYLDRNWKEVNEAFYIAMNPTDFKSHNLVQQSNKI